MSKDIDIFPDIIINSFRIKLKIIINKNSGGLALSENGHSKLEVPYFN